MDIESAAIRRAADIAERAGNSIATITGIWRPKQTVFMTSQMTADVRSTIEVELPHLRYFSNEPTPHNPADEGFISVEDDVLISFPTPGETRRWY